MRETSFRRKLLLLIALAVGGGQALMTVLVLWGEAERYAVNKKELLLAQAHVMAAAVSGATARGDVNGVYAGLRGAGSLPDIRFVSVIGLDGARIAELGAAELLNSDLLIDRTTPLSAWSLLRARSFALRAPVVQGGSEVGAVVLIGDAGDLKASLKSGLLTFAGAAAAALSLALAITLRLQTILTRPLTGLVRAMQSVATSHNYSLSAPHSEISELKVLIDGFNGMLSGIRERDLKIARSYAELEQQVQDRTRDLSAAKEAAEALRAMADEANAHKSTFLATMSHEIRTPMNGVLVMAELLTRSPLPPAAQRYADVIWRSGKSLLAIINDILDFSKIEAGKLELECAPFDLDETVATVLDLFGEKARAKGLDLAARIAVDAPRTVVGDPVRLTQILSNLVNNALKFTERGGVRVIVEPGEARGDVRFRVEDTGIGIAPDRLDAIFAAFSQADMSTTRKYGGTGLGLAISQRLAQAMGAEIEAASEPAKGSVFSFTLRNVAQAWTPWPACATGAAEIAVCIKSELTRDALAYYGRSAGASTFVGELDDNVRPGGIVIVDREDRITISRAQRLDCRIVEVRSSGDAEAVTDATLSWPVARSEFEALLRNWLAGRELQPTTHVRAGNILRKFNGLKVLVADDNEINREVARESLERLGASVTLVSDGQEAVAAHAQSRFDLLLLDGSMPGLSGFDAARRIRRREKETRMARTPIIAFTAHVLGASATEWRDAEMDGCLAKPFTLEQLSRSIEAALGALSLAQLAAEHVEEDLIDRSALGELVRLSSRDKDFLARVVRLYTSHAPGTVETIRRCAAEGDRDALAKAAHALKSMSLNIGARAVAASAARLEADAGQAAPPAAGRLEALGRLVAATCEALTQEAAGRLTYGDGLSKPQPLVHRAETFSGDKPGFREAQMVNIA